MAGRIATLRPASDPSRINSPVIPILRSPRIPPGPYFHNGTAYATIRPCFITGNSPHITICNYEIRTYLFSATEQSENDFRLWLSAAIAKHCNFWPVYNSNDHCRVKFLSTMASFAAAMQNMMTSGTTNHNAEDELKVKEKRLTTALFAVEPAMLDACFKANGDLLAELFDTWPQLPSTGEIAATKDEITHVKELLGAEFIHVRVPENLQMSRNDAYRTLEDLRENVVRLLEVAYVEAEDRIGSSN